MVKLSNPELLETTKSRENLGLICNYCNEVFFRTKHSYFAALNPKTETNLEFCSVRCRNLANQSRKIVECTTCGISVEKVKKELEKSNNSFCSRSCSAKHSNKERKKPLKLCVECGKGNVKHNKKFCSNSCQFLNQYKTYISKWKEGLETGVTGKQGTSNYIRRYLFQKNNNKCEECGWSKINKVTGKVPLTIEHIDGNWQNNNEDNLKLLCPNCHSLTETYGALNKGNGRKGRYGVLS